MSQTQLAFKVSKGSLVYATHADGSVILADQPDERIDLVCHLFEGPNKALYYAFLTKAPDMLGLLREISQLDGRKGLSKKSDLWKRIHALTTIFQEP